MLSVSILIFLTSYYIYKNHMKENIQNFLEQVEKNREAFIKETHEQQTGWSGCLSHSPQSEQKRLLTCKNRCCRFYV